jgi:hypothetical protein
LGSTESWILYNVVVFHAFFKADLLISIFSTFALILKSEYLTIPKHPQEVLDINQFFDNREGC